MIKAVLFDLDGTLLNRDESLKIFVHNQYERLLNGMGHINKGKFVMRFIELDNRGYVWKDKVYKELVSEFDITKISWEELLEDYINQFKLSCQAFPNLISMLEGLKLNNFKIGMITNGIGDFQMGNIKELGIEKYFDIILVSETEGLKKPDSQIFFKALEKLNILPEESIYIGDHPDNDIKASKKIGMKAIWKKDFIWKCMDADFIIEDLAEIPLLIEKLNKPDRKINTGC